MYSPPHDPATTHRMRTQHDHAARTLGITVGNDDAFWGWEGRTLGRAGTTTDSRHVWLRLTTAPEAKATGKLWEGNETAQKAFGTLSGHRPALLTIHDWTEDGTAYRAELNEHLDTPVISSDPILRTPATLFTDWWTDLRTALDAVVATETDRVAVRQEYIERALPEFLGLPAPENILWATAHGDLHWANLTAPGLRILDWEGWGLAPYGYDQATLYAYSLLEPATADRVRAIFPQLGTPATWAGEAVIVAELLQTISRGHNQDLAEPLHAWAGHLRNHAPQRP